MPRKKLSKSQKIRNMLDANIPVRQIAEKMSVPPKTVYNIRYQYNKRKGLGALPPRKKAIVVPKEANRASMKPEVQQFPTQKEQETSLVPWLLAICAFLIIIIFLSK